MRRLAAFTLVLLTAGSIGTTTAHAQEVTAVGKYCATVISDEVDAEGMAITLGRACSDDSPSTAFAALPRHARMQADTALMIWHEHANYQGNGDVIYGSSGVCDRDGYYVRTSAYWAYRLSSISRIATCDRAYVTNIQQSYSTTYGLSTPVLEPGHNDAVQSVRVYSSYA